MRRYTILILCALMLLPVCPLGLVCPETTMTLMAQTKKKTTTTKKKTTTKKSTTSTRKKAATTTRKKTTAKPAAKRQSKSQLQNQKAATQRKITSSKRRQEQLEKSIRHTLDSVMIIDNQMREQQKEIDSLREDINSLNIRIRRLNTEMRRLQNDLDDKKAKYAKALVYMHRQKSVQQKLMFVFSADNFSQMFRRMRYLREYSLFQKAQGELIQKKQEELRLKEKELLEAKAALQKTKNAVEARQAKLKSLKANCESKAAYLNKNLRTVKDQIARYQREEAELNERIDRIIQEELEAARRREEEMNRQREAAAQPGGKKVSEKERRQIEKWVSDSENDVKLSKDFVANKGRLPMPITGDYNIVRHYGRYTVPGLSGVVLDNKGVDIRGKAGASARAVFDGEVSSIFKPSGEYVVMVRHGKYISVYTGLSSVSVKVGDKVKTRQSLGKLAKDKDGNYVLHFQLRRERSRLNPEQWVR